MKHNQLQVSTLEGLYHDLVDMLDDDATRDHLIRLFTEITLYQKGQVGLGLRQQFFKVCSIRSTKSKVSENPRVGL